MNIQEYDLMNCLMNETFINQRILSEVTGYSLGKVNSSLKKLIELGYLTEQMQCTDKAYREVEEKKPKNAIILAAGFGMRMVPINAEVPKGILEVRGETLIERLIKQLHEVGIREIDIVVGFMKEQYEYLIDEYGVNLVYNKDYSTKNNLYSLEKVMNKIENTYILPCDIWCLENLFSHKEWYSWYMVSDKEIEESNVRINRKKELVLTKGNELGNQMIGISYVLESEAEILRKNMLEFLNRREHIQSFWEEAAMHNGKMILKPREVSSDSVYEINTLEDLRNLDEDSDQLNSEILSLIAETLKCDTKEITEIVALKKGMTNRSFRFSCNGKRYIMRVPGEGTGELINREQEAMVYDVIRDKEICDNICYINPSNGYKITEYLENVRVCNPLDANDVKGCMKKLREFHDMELKVEHEFDIFERILFYESLWDGKPSIYKNYNETKKNVFSLKEYIEKHVEKTVLTHIDAVPDNFLFVEGNHADEEIRLIDWEYAAMQDPHVDIAMFCIYALYNRQQVDDLISEYFTKGCSESIKTKIYCYIAACGLLWSNWCEYKRNLGVEFGEYSLRQYRYAKEYYKIVQDELKKIGE